MIYYSPILSFFTQIDYYEFTRYLYYISKYKSGLEVNHDYFLSEWDKSVISTSPCWLVVNDKAPKYISSSRIYNLFSLSVWTLSPTELEIRYKLKERDGVTLIFDRFMYNGVDKNKNEYELDDLNEIKEYFKSFVKILRTNKRLLLALDSTFRGCTSYYWKVAFLMYAAALEAVLTYSRERGITRRLAKSYACIMSDKNPIRDKLYREFYYLYDIRSEIMHGSYKKRRSRSSMKNLSRISVLVRMMWQKILSDKKILIELEKNDSQREMFFKSIIGNYSSPKI